MTVRGLVVHSYEVMVIRRLGVVAIVLALVAGNGAVCAGWAPSAEARMACCSDGEPCPMHRAGANKSGLHGVTQAQADSCCASSEREDSSQSSPTFAPAISSAVLGTGILMPAIAPTLILTDARGTAAPVPLTHLPKHILLSVYLV